MKRFLIEPKSNGKNRYIGTVHKKRAKREKGPLRETRQNLFASVLHLSDTESTTDYEDTTIMCRDDDFNCALKIVTRY